MDSYYNTTSERGTALLHRESKAKSQERDLLNFLTDHKGEAFTADQLMREFPMKRSSMARSLANLRSRHLIQKSTEARYLSDAGVKCFAWRVKP